MKNDSCSTNFAILLANNSRIDFTKKGQKQSRNRNCDSFGIGIDTALEWSAAPDAGFICGNLQLRSSTHSTVHTQTHRCHASRALSFFVAAIYRYESHYSRHCDEMFAKEGCLKFRDMHKLACARIAVKYFYDNLPRGNMDCFLERKSAYEIRNSIRGKNLKIPSSLTKQMEQMCCVKIPMIWNKEVPSEMKSLQETAFIHAYKEHFLQEYRSFTCDGRQWLRTCRG